MKKRSKIFFLFGLVVFLSSYFFVHHYWMVQADEVVDDLKKVKVERVHVFFVNEFFESSGIVRGEEEADLSFESSGKITAIYKKSGDSIRKGDILATLDGEEELAERKLVLENISTTKENEDMLADYYDQLVDESRSAKEKAEEKYEITKKTGSSDDISLEKKNFEVAKESLESAKKMRDMQKQMIGGQLGILEKQLGVSDVRMGNTKIVAPYAGVILSSNFDTGSLVGPQAAVFSIAKSQNKEISITVPTKVSSKIKTGSDVVLERGDGSVFNGTIESISFGSGLANYNAIVVIKIYNSEISLGEFVRVRIAQEEEKLAIMIPISSVVKKYDDNFVFVVNGNLVTEKKVDLGMEVDGKVEIINGISDGDVIVISGQNYLKDGEEVSYE